MRRACSAICRGLLERAGPGVEGSGSITGVFSVLVDGDDHNDPVADNIRGTLDGHIVLDRAIADQGRYPAVNMLASISRLAQPRWTPEQRALVARLRALIARYRGDARIAADGRLHARRRPDARPGGQDRAAHLRCMTQMLNRRSCDDPFVDLAAALRPPDAARGRRGS